MARIGLKLREAARQHGADTAYQILREAIKERKVQLGDFSLREMAQSFMGDSWENQLERYRGSMALRESADAVDASAFASITGQLLIDTVREKYQIATQVTDAMFRVQPITNGNLGVQREPSLSRVKHNPSPVNQGMPYPTTNFDPQFVDYPAPEKYGEICNVTMEMIFSDLTKQAVESAESVGEMTGLWVEYRRLAVVLGLINNHSWNGTTYNTYLASGAWINRLVDFTLTDWTSINRLEQLFTNMVDPVTGKPIQISVKDMLVMPSLKYMAKRILNATEVRSGDITTGAGNQTVSANPLENNYTLYCTPHARKVAIDGVGDPGDMGRIAGGFTAPKAESIVVAGDFKRAFVWRQVYPVKTVQAPPLNPLEFNQDIVLSVKSSVFGVACVAEPRNVLLAFNDSAT